MPRPSSISFIPAPVNRCQHPTFITQPASTTVPAGGGSVTLSVNPGGTGPFEYNWIRVSDFQTVGATQSITVNVTANEKFYVVVNNACGYEESQIAEVTVGGCVAPTIHGIAKLRQPDGTYLLEPDISAGPQRQYSWVRLSDSTQIATTETVTVPAPVSDMTYRFTLTDNSCNNSSTSLDVTLTDTPTITKTDLVATATAGSAQVTITWPASDGNSYALQRRSGAEWQVIASNLTGTSSVSYVDNAVAANKTYAYRAYAVRSGKTSDFSNTDVATTRSFLQAVVGQSITPASFDDMLAAVNSVRAAAGWTPVTWSNILSASDPLPQPSSSIIDRHVTSARSRMNEALSALGASLPVYAKKTVVGAPIEAADVNEVQQRAQ
jgi:hypothetical protein